MENVQQGLETAQLLGLTLPTPLYVFGAVVFGFIGLFAYYRGKRRGLPVFKWIGVVLMVYPLLVSETWLMYAIGVALCAGLFSCRE